MRVGGGGGVRRRRRGNLVSPDKPEQKQHTVEQVLEQVGVQQFKPLWVVGYRQGNHRNAEDIENINAQPAKRNEPALVVPRTPRGKKNDKPDERLLDSRATPYDRNAAARVEYNLRPPQDRRVAKPMHDGVHDRGNVLREPIKGTRNIPPDAGNAGMPFIARDGQFPYPVRREQRHDKHKDVRVGAYVKFAFWHTGLRPKNRNRGLNT